MSEQNKTNVRRLFEEVWNKGHVAVADELFAPTYTHDDSSTPDVGRGPESEKKRATLYRNAFPDVRFTIEDIIAEGETVVARWSCHGTHKGDRIADPGTGFDPAGAQYAAVTTHDKEPMAHTETREERGLRPGGYGIQLARSLVDELIYNEAHNQVAIIKYLN